VAKANAKILTRRIFPKYANRSIKGFDIEQDVEEESTDDQEEHEEVFTLGRMNTRSQTRVSWYFTAKEVEEEEAIQAIEIGKGKEKEVLTRPWNILQDDGTIVVEEDEGVEDDDDTEPEYDPSDEDDNFDQDVDGDQDIADENMD